MQTSFKPWDAVVLNHDCPEDGLKAGDTGHVIMVYEKPRRYEVEFLELDHEGVSHRETYIVVNEKDAQ